MIHQRKILKAVAYAILLCFTSLTGAQPLYAVPSNTQVPTYTDGNLGIGVTENTVGNVMDIHQTTQTAVNQWDNFSIGADATVNFTGTHKGFNSFNYVKNGGPISEIYGQINAIGGNIFIANPAGVQIGNSAQINVGSLYVTNKNLEGSIDGIKNAQTSDAIRDIIAAQTAGTAQLMSLGSITSATNVTFDGGRIVLDTDRLFTSENGIAGETQLESMADINKNLTIRTNDEKNVVLGYTAYKSDSPDKVGVFTEDPTPFTNIFLNNNNMSIAGGIGRYMWVEDLFQLQAMGNHTNGWFALRNAIDANYSAKMNEGATFDPITNFTGRFDGLDYHIFGLTINRETESNVGLFGSVGGEAIIRNVTLNGGSITGGENVGSIAGSVSENATIENITNTADVKGNKNVGGVIGSLTGTNGEPDVHNFVNAGTVSGVTNVGGIVGSAANVTLDGRIYNLGAVIGIDTGDDTNKTWSSNVGGIAGYATNTTIGNALDGENAEDFQIYNQLGVTGGYNVGGIVGSIEGDSTITNVANHGDVKATGFTKEKYEYHSASNGNQLEDEHVDDVHVANVGGIAGSTGDDDDIWVKPANRVQITDVQNDGDVTTASTTKTYDIKNDSSTEEGKIEQYNAGNVGGIVGSAKYVDIKNAENSENLVAGAHNVGGIAGYMLQSKVDSSQNDGGDITATGARTDGGFATEAVMGDHEKYNIGNIGGIAGYLHGNETKISNSANRGTVHSAYFDGNTAPYEAKTANVGGVVGKVSMRSQPESASTESVLTSLKANSSGAIIYNSYNTGDVQGYTGVGGVAGQMVKGSIADSYNLGDVATTRRANAGTVDAVNMGGVVGDTTAVTDGSSTAIYNVYNAGTIGDSEYEFLGRHVGGVVGRLGGALEKAYNTGDIYNGYSVTGGVVGYWVSGNIKNVFNTGNVTVVNYDLNARNSLVGGIVGAATSDYDKKLSFAYNLGTLRSFIPEGYERIEVQEDTLQDGKKVLVSNKHDYTDEEKTQYQNIINNVIFSADDGVFDSENDGKYNKSEAYQLENINVVGGIIGGVTESNVDKDVETITVDNVYSTGNIFAGRFDTENQKYEKSTNPSDRVSAIWGRGYTNGDGQKNVELTNSFFIKPDDENLFSNVDTRYNRGGYTELDWDDRAVIDEETKENHYRQQNDTNKFTFYEIDKATEDNNYAYGWRFEDGTLPILYAFTPDSAKHETEWNTNGYDVQFGTAANPLLTIIKGSENVQLNWDKLHISGAGGLAVYDGNLTINNFSTQMGRYYNGIIFSDGNLTINANGDGRYNLGSGARLYGDNVTFTAEGDTTIYGSITSTNGNIEISGNNVSVIGELTASGADDEIHVGGIAPNASAADSGGMPINEDDLIDPEKPITTVDMAYSHKTVAAQDGSITVTADKNAEVLYGNMGEGRIETALDFTVSGKESVYVDSDLHIGRHLNLKSDGEIVLDLSNMGDISKENLHNNFLDHFKKDDAGRSDGAINVYGVENAANLDNFMIALDMWDYQNNKFDLEKYDVAEDEYDGVDEHDLVDDLNALNISGVTKAQDHTFIWVDGAEQLKGIQAYKDMKDGEQEETSILSYNFALKDDIDASQLENYKGIAADKDEVFSGTFDGRGFRIIGLDANDDGTKKVDNAGIFGTIGVARDTGGKITQTGIVKDLSVYSSHFTGEDTAGAIAGRNEGEITGVVTFGNEVKVTGTNATTTIQKGKSTGDKMGDKVYVGAAGGIVGVNTGDITDVHASDTVIASEGGSYDTNKDYMTVAGGVVGINHADMDNEKNGSIGTPVGDTIGVVSTSAVITDTSLAGGAKILHGLGGIAGINEYSISNAAALGATNGSYGAQGASANEYVGGIMGINYSTNLYYLYNESAVIGASNVGGIVGKNDYREDLKGLFDVNKPDIGFYYDYIGGELSQVVNAGSVTAITDIIGPANKTTSNVGGIAGTNYGVINRGRNTGTITGVDSVGGIVGLNAEGAEITNLSNAVAAEITGETNVGGIAGINKGEITAESNLVNEGKITGVLNVGGIAGKNEATGVISGGTHESGAELTNRAEISGTQYVGGIAGENLGTITNTNVESKITAVDDESGNIQTQYFGGVTGSNSGTIINAMNTGTVTADGATLVGGITGENKTKDDGTGGVLENAGNSGDVSGLAQVGGVAGKNSSTNVEGTIVNSGNVTAKQDGAAGIFYVNDAKLDGITLRNDGTVHVTGAAGNETGTGGVIGINNGEIINSTLTNNFTVTGGNNTGGLIGINNADISYSTLVSTVNSHVEGKENTGGLIGKNTGSVTGGRNEADTMYEHKIYNNGTVNARQGDNVGGLIGNNEGTLSAGYNTGSVSGVSNVGGIAGTNSGKISEVFNTIMTGEETGNRVSGADNVGGLVGNNSGTLTDAYNTTAVSGGTNTGNAVGLNGGTITNVYATNTSGKLIGGGSGTAEKVYTFSKDDESAKLISGGAQNQSGSYDGFFGFDSAWKNYDYWTTPMLKVFLTKGEYKDGVVTAADGLAAFGNANSLIVFVPDPATGGMFMTVYSSQIASSLNPDGTFNPNNLGYDLEGFSVYMGINNGHLHSDGWDRLRNFRERKAELYFHEGGMEYAEDM